MKCDTHINGITCGEDIHMKDMETGCVLDEFMTMTSKTTLVDLVILCQDENRGQARINLFSRILGNGQGKVFRWNIV